MTKFDKNEKNWEKFKSTKNSNNLLTSRTAERHARGQKILQIFTKTCWDILYLVKKTISHSYFVNPQDKGSVYNNPELEMIAKEIQSLLSEKIQIEKEIQETEYNISLKNTEQNSLQGEFDTLSSTLKQLTNQKDVAQRRLDDLDTQVMKEISNT